MKECPKCGELNGDTNGRCYKCNTALESVPSYKKICPKCKTIYSAKKDTCDQCHIPLAVYNQEILENSGIGTDRGMFVIALLFPLIGIIMGLIYLARQEDDVGKSVLITSIVAGVVWGIIFSVIFLL